MSDYDSIMKKYRDNGTVLSSTDLESFKITRIPSGILTLDLQTNGGIPEGRIISFFGAKGCSKTNLAYIYINNYLNKHPGMKAVLIDAELTFDPVWAMCFIGHKNMDRLGVVRTQYGEEAVSLAEEMGKSSDIGLIVVDSTAALVPLGSVKKEATEEQKPGDHAKLINKLFNRLVPLQAARILSKNKHLTLILINHFTYAIGGSSFAPQIVKPGGRKQEYLFSMDIRLYYVEACKVMNSTPVIQKYQFNVIKNKTGIGNVQGEFRLVMINHEDMRAGEIDQTKDILNYAKKYGVLVRTGNKWAYKDASFSNLNEITDFLKDKNNLNKMKLEVLEKGLLNSLMEDVNERDTTGV